MPLRLALGVRGTVAGRRMGARRGKGVPPPHPMHPWGGGVFVYVWVRWLAGWVDGMAGVGVWGGWDQWDALIGCAGWCASTAMRP